MRIDTSSISPDDALPELNSLFLGDEPNPLRLYVEDWQRTFPLRKVVKDFATCLIFPNSFYGEDWKVRLIWDRIEEEAQCAILDGSLASAAKAELFPVRAVDYAVWFADVCFREPIRFFDAGRIEISRHADIFRYFAILKKREERDQQAVSCQPLPIPEHIGDGGSKPRTASESHRAAKQTTSLAAKLGASAWRDITAEFGETGLRVRGPSKRNSHLLKWQDLGLDAKEGTKNQHRLWVLLGRVAASEGCYCEDSVQDKLRKKGRSGHSHPILDTSEAIESEEYGDAIDDDSDKSLSDIKDGSQIRKTDLRGRIRRDVHSLNELLKHAFGLMDGPLYNEAGFTKSKFASFRVAKQVLVARDKHR